MLPVTVVQLCNSCPRRGPTSEHSYSLQFFSALHSVAADEKWTSNGTLQWLPLWPAHVFTVMAHKHGNNALQCRKLWHFYSPSLIQKWVLCGKKSIFFFFFDDGSPFPRVWLGRCLWHEATFLTGVSLDLDKVMALKAFSFATRRVLHQYFICKSLSLTKSTVTLKCAEDDDDDDYKSGGLSVRNWAFQVSCSDHWAAFGKTIFAIVAIISM